LVWDSAAANTAVSAIAGWFMTSPHDNITVGRVTLVYSVRRRGWVTPSGLVIKNLIKAQLIAERLNITQGRAA
jgi:hypothetical protein